jgi:hypothetical protein
LEVVSPGDVDVGDWDKIRLLIRAKGYTIPITVDKMGTVGEPSTIGLQWPPGRLECQLHYPTDTRVAGARIKLPGWRQPLFTRADGGFILDGLPEGESLDQLDVRQGDVTLEPKRSKDGKVIILTGEHDPLEEPVVIRIVTRDDL